MREYPYAYVGFIQWDVKKMKALGEKFDDDRPTNQLMYQWIDRVIGSYTSNRPDKIVFDFKALILLSCSSATTTLNLF